jgi:hypothetical protein
VKANVVLGLLGSVVTLVVLFEMLRRQRLREKYAVFWAIVAVVTLLVAAFPVILDRAASAAGVAVPANLLFFGASMLLMVISVQHSSELGRLEERSRTLAEELALLRMELTALKSDQEVAPAPDTRSSDEVA